jgi:hypothetical protein
LALLPPSQFSYLSTQNGLPRDFKKISQHIVNYTAVMFSFDAVLFTDGLKCLYLIQQNTNVAVINLRRDSLPVLFYTRSHTPHQSFLLLFYSGNKNNNSINTNIGALEVLRLIGWLSDNAVSTAETNLTSATVFEDELL